MKLPLKETLGKRRVLLIVIGANVVITGMVFGYAEYSAHRQVELRSSEYSQARQDIYRQLSGDELTSDDLVSVQSLAARTADGHCEAPAIAQWRISSDQQSQCVVRQEGLASLNDNASTLLKYLENDQQVAEVFEATAKELSAVKASDYTARQKVWRQTWEKFEGMTVEPDYQGRLTQYGESVERVIDRYGKLIAADKAQKRSQFDDAVTELQDAYESLAEVKANTDEPYADQVSALLDSVEGLPSA